MQAVYACYEPDGWLWSAGRFLKMFLGPINVCATRKDVQLKVKEEYNKYRVMFLLGFAQLYCFSSWTIFIRWIIHNKYYMVFPFRLYEFLLVCLHVIMSMHLLLAHLFLSLWNMNFWSCQMVALLNLWILVVILRLASFISIVWLNDSLFCLVCEMLFQQ